MDKFRLGRSNLTVSKLGLGGGPLIRVPEDEAVGVIRRCLELGINFIDTANSYGPSEERIGKAISGLQEVPIVATKSMARTREEIERHLHLSLNRLGVESIDLYQLHDVSDFDTYDKVVASNGPLTVLTEAMEAGRVKHIGISSHQIDVAKAAIKSDLFETIMFPFNFIAGEPADELIPLARKHDVGFIAMKPLAGGALDNVAIAFKYLFQFPDVLPIPGIQHSQQIEEIVQVLNGSHHMTENERKEMQRLREELGTQFCRQCNYCQPCSADIPISTVVYLPEFGKPSPPERLFSGAVAEAMKKAADCIECGECEERCPYNLPIREMLAERVKWFEAEKIKYMQQSLGNLR